MDQHTAERLRTEYAVAHMTPLEYQTFTMCLVLFGLAGQAPARLAALFYYTGICTMASLYP